MARTSVPGTQGAAASSFQLAAGGPQAATFQVQWTGPFNPGEVTFLGNLNWTDIVKGAPVTVNLQQLESITLSDNNWWVITG